MIQRLRSMLKTRRGRVIVAAAVGGVLALMVLARRGASGTPTAATEDVGQFEPVGVSNAGTLTDPYASPFEVPSMAAAGLIDTSQFEAVHERLDQQSDSLLSLQQTIASQVSATTPTPPSATTPSKPASSGTSNASKAGMGGLAFLGGKNVRFKNPQGNVSQQRPDLNRAQQKALGDAYRRARASRKAVAFKIPGYAGTYRIDALGKGGRVR